MKRKSQRALRQRKRSARGRRRATLQRPPTAIIPPAPPQPLVGHRRPELTRDEIDLLKKTVAKGTTDDEFALFLWVAKKHKLDPMTRQLHCVKRGEVMTIQIGIDGYRALAARHHKDYGALDEPEYELDKNGALVSARIRVWKKGFEHPIVAVAYWKEYAPDLNTPQAFMWRKMPKLMLAKCAESQALRKAYPDLSDIYTDEEMAQANEDYAPSGRRLLVAGERPSDARITQTPEYKAQVSASLESANEAAKQATVRKVVKIAFLENGRTKVTGDIAAITHRLKVECLGNWNPTLKFWEVPGSHAHVLAAICNELGYDFVEDSGLPSPQKQPEMAQTEKPRTPSATGVSKAVPQAGAGLGHPPTGMNPPSQPAPADNRIVRVKSADSKGRQYVSEKGSPYIQVLWRGVWLPCFDQRLFQFLEAGIGKDAELIVNKKHVIVGLKRVGDRSFDDDGRTPQIDVNEPRGQSLF